MKIGIISTIKGYSWGGSEELWAEMATEAQKINCQLIISLYSHPEKANKIAGLEKAGAKVFYHRSYAYRFWIRFYHQFRRKILQREQFFPVKTNSPFRFFFNEQPDVICINQGDPYSFLMLPDLVEYLSLTKIPYVVISQGAFPYQILTYEDRKQMRFFFRNAYRTLFVAKANQDLVERQIASRIDNGYILNNPANIDGNEILPYPESEVLKIGLVARLEIFHKAIDVLFEALSGEQWKKRSWELNLYGKGADEEYLKELAILYKIDDKINFIGQVSDIKKVWLTNQLAILTSYSEGFPLSIIEAMLCGRSALVTDVGGMSEIINDSEDGFIAEYPTAYSIREALEKVWENRHLLKEMGVNAFSKVASKYDLRPGATLLNLLQEAVSKNNSNL